ncbi:MAG: PilZ domain-containing protein [Spirochaetes bacterium]|jgi:uncharacterized protein (TIGR02266 family)|nr:PilZ domain-containing protein [Spirochaetota bacterium]
MDEKRNFERIGKKLRAEVHVDDGMTFSASVDISIGGVFISTPEPLQEGQHVNLAIYVSQDETVNVSGNIKWTRDETEEMPAGMGIQFSDLSEGDKSKIEKIIN